MRQTWEMVPLKEILTERQEIPSNESLLTGKISIVAKIGFNDGKIQIRTGNNTKTGMILIKPGDLVISGINAAKGSIAIYAKENTKPIAATIHYGAYIVNQERSDIQYLWLLLRSRTFQDLLLQYVPGGIKTELKAKRLLPIPIPLPPLDEQRRIVARIEELATKVEEARGLRRQSVEEAEALIIANQAKIFQEAYKKQVTRFDQIATLERGKFSHRPRNDPRFFGGEHPWIQIAEIESSGKYISDWSQTLNDEGLAISRKFPKGTLLISIAATIGAVGILDFDCCIPDSIAAITPNSGTESEYIYHYLCYIRSNLEQIAPQNAQKNINLKIIAALPVPELPPGEQHRIVAYLDDLQAKIDGLKRLQAETATELDALIPSILDKAFKGEL
jgi:type I restriction enzyme S subunit